MFGTLSVGASSLTQTLRARWRLIVAIVIVAVAGALIVSLAQTKRYQASAITLFGVPSFENVPATATGTPASTTSSPQDQATDLDLASLDVVAAGVKQRLAGSSSVEDLRNAVSVQPVGNSNLVSVTATWDTPTGAAELANAFADEIVAFRRATAQAEVQQRIDAINSAIGTQQAGAAGRSGGSAATTSATQSLTSELSQLQAVKAQQTGNVQVVQRATPPVAASSRNILRNALIAAVVGLAIGIGVVLLLAQFDERVGDEGQLADLISAPVLARIPKLAGTRRRDHRALVRQDRAFVEAFELLRVNLQLTRMQQGSVVAAVTGATAGDGTTTVVASLARSLALSGADVIAVDFDLTTPKLHDVLGVHQGVRGGVVEAVRDTTGGDDLAQTTEYAGLRVLAAGQDPLPTGGISQEGLQLMLARLRDQADYVLIDTSPVSIGADASAAVAAADGVILVVDLGRIRRRDLLAAKRQLEIARATILGVVVNRARAHPPAYRPDERAAGVAVDDASRHTFR